MTSAPERVAVRSTDGIGLYASTHRPVTPPRAGLLVVHGLQSHAGWFEAAGTGEYLSSRGVLSLAFDRRGSGRSQGEQGHLVHARDFLTDLSAARAALATEVAAAGAPDAPLHVLANCFGTRVVLPFLLDQPGAFASVTLTSPATHMSRRGDYGPLSRLAILLSPGPRRFGTPLRDEDFVSSGPWLQWIRRDELSLRSCTAAFLRGAAKLTAQMKRAVGRLEVPLLVLLARDDVLVRNEAIRRAFRARYPGPLQVRELPGDHYMDFTEAQGEFRDVLADWLLGAWSAG